MPLRILTIAVSAALLVARCGDGSLSATEPAAPAADQQATTEQEEPKSAPQVDEARAATAGIRKLSGRHLTLYTDLPAAPAVDELVDVFDAAYPQWCEYFGVRAERDRDWHVVACVIADKRRFASIGLLPDDLPPFLHAYYHGDRIWVYDQPTDYYRRHLLLHEGTHAFEDHFFGANGPPWYSEGTAELLGTHRWQRGRLRLNSFPTSADDVPGWGRIRLVHDAINAGRRLKLDEVLAFDGRAHIEVEPYGWCWAALALLERHPHYRDRFHSFRDEALRLKPAEVNKRLREKFGGDWEQLAEDFQLFTADLDYGYDFNREAIDYHAGKPLAAAGARVTVAADRGWQSSGVALEAGKSYRVSATGRYQVAAKPRAWMCEPDGVTIRYWRGLPLGVLLGAVRPDHVEPAADSSLLSPVVIGHEAVIRPTSSGTLYLRINDAAAELADNAGTIEVKVVEDRGE